MKRLVEDRLGGTTNLIRPQTQTLEPSNLRFKRHEVDYAIRTLSKDKAPGLDLLDVRMLQSLHTAHNKLLLRLYNSCARLGYFPDKWKQAEVVFFVKKGKAADQETAKPAHNLAANPQ